MRGDRHLVRLSEVAERRLLCSGDGFRGLLESFVLRTLQQFCDVQQDDETALQFAHSGYVAGLAFGEDRTGRIDFRRRDLEDLGRGVDDKADQFVFQFNDEDAIFLVRNDFGLTETLSEIHHRNDFSAKINHTFDQIRSARNGSDFGNADNFAHGANSNAVRFIADPETYNVQILFHREGPCLLRASHFGVFEFLIAVRFRSAALPGRIPTAGVRRSSAVQNEAVHAVQQVAGKLQHLLRSSGQLGRARSGLLDQLAHFVHGTNDGLGAGSLLFDGGVNLLGNFRKPAGGFGNLRGANGLFVGGRTDFLRELVNFGDDVGNFVQRGAKIVAKAQALFDDAGAALHVFDGLACFALNALDEVGDFLGGLRGLFRKLANLIGDNREAETMLTSTGGFDGGVKGEQVGLFGQVVDDFDDFPDVISAMAEDVDDFRGRLNGLVGAIEAVGGLLHGLNAGDHFLAGTVGDIQKNFRGIGDALNRGDHLVDGSGCFRDAGGLYLSVLDDVLHVNAHLVHGAGDFFDGRGSLNADLGRFIGSASNLVGAGRDLSGGIARGADQFLQAMGHAKEGVAESVALGARHDFHGEVAFGDGHGNAGHLLEVGHHIVEGGGESSDFIVAVNVNVLIEIAGVANFARDGDEVRQGFGDGPCRIDRDEATR